MKKKDITNDDLAVMISKGFAETAKKTDMDRQFKEVDERFDKIESRLEIFALGHLMSK